MKKRNVEWKDRTLLEKIALILSIPILIMLVLIVLFDLSDMYNFIYTIIGIELICFAIIKNRSSVISYFIGLIGIITIIIGIIL